VELLKSPCFQVENVFTTLHGERARIARRKFEVEEGDLLTALNIFLAFEKSGRNRAWCNAHFLRFKGLHHENFLSF
jgi:ATP-dependent RNA helicase DDX35